MHTDQNQAFDLVAPARRTTPAPAGLTDSAREHDRSNRARRAAIRRASALKGVRIDSLMRQRPGTTR